MKVHETPILSKTGNQVPVYILPNEDGFFPTGDKTVVLLGPIEPKCHIYQLPNVSLSANEQGESMAWTLLSKGSLELRNPAPGSPKEVALVGECDGLVFYIMQDDVTLTLSPRELVLICVPSMDCLYISLASETSEKILVQMQSIFSSRTNLYRGEGGTTVVDRHIESIRRSLNNSTVRPETMAKNKYQDGKEEDDDLKHVIPEDNVHQSIYQSSKWIKKQIVHLSEMGARQVEGHGDRLRSSLRKSSSSNVSSSADSSSVTEENKNVINIHPMAVQSASQIRKFSKTARKTAEQVSDSISNMVGSAIASTIVEKPKDTESTRAARQLLRTSVIAYGEISDGVGEGFDILSRATKREATACVAVKYGDEAADLTRHTLGATNNFVKTALTCRRILDVKKVAKSSVKCAVKQSLTSK